MWHWPCKNGRTDRTTVWDGEWSGSKNRVLDGRAHWRHGANTVERLCAAAMSESATRGGDAACSQIVMVI